MSTTLHCGDCLEIMQRMEDNSIDAVVTDPPYGIGLFGEAWDACVPGVDYWAEVLRVAKPGAHMAAFGGSRSFHHLVTAIEQAGWEVRDVIYWAYSQGAPRNRDISKDMDRIAGADREVIGRKKDVNGQTMHDRGADAYADLHPDLREAWQKRDVTERGFAWETAPATENAVKWNGWGTALKAAVDPVVLVRKPLSEKNVALNVLKWGCGAVFIDSLRDEKGRYPANLWLGDDDVNLEDWKGRDVTGFYPRIVYEGKVTRRADKGEGNNHPAVKPVRLLSKLVRLITPDGGVVLDPFMGSGSTGLGVIASGVKDVGFTGIERESDYIKIAARRIKKAAA
jgi:site-specific DNA-methyltransferase (adenine-specific)